MLNVIHVKDSKQKKEFLEFPTRLFKDYKNYIRPLDKDINSIFDTKTNKLFKIGECERFIFQNKNNETVGKVAVFNNPKYINEQPTGGIGFFDCIDDQDTANYIFDFCKNWLTNRGLEAMDGSINFGERDKFWGVLVDGFEEPLYGMNFNPPYYKNLFENYGFKTYFQQLCYSRPIHAPLSDTFVSQYEKYENNEDFKALPLKKNKLEKFAKDFADVYNLAWASHEGGKQMNYKKTISMFNNMKPIINENISWFVYYKNKPIAIWLNIPDLNQWFKHLNGKFGIIEKITFLWHKFFTGNTKMVGLVFGIIPEWQKKGIDGYMIVSGTKHIRNKTKFKTTELQWIGDFNPKMMKIAENLDTVITKRLITYRYLFDPNKDFKTHRKL